MTALRCTPPLPSRTVPALMVMGCWALAGAVMPKKPASPANAAATGAATIDRVRIGPPPWRGVFRAASTIAAGMIGSNLRRRHRIRRDACDPARRKAFPRRRHRTVEIDAAAGIRDDDDPKPFAGGVLGRIAHAEIEGEASEECAQEATLAQIAGKAGRRRAVVFVECRVGIDRLAEALAHHQRGMGDIERKMEIGAWRFL